VSQKKNHFGRKNERACRTGVGGTDNLREENSLCRAEREFTSFVQILRLQRGTDEIFGHEYPANRSCPWSLRDSKEAVWGGTINDSNAKITFRAVEGELQLGLFCESIWSTKMFSTVRTVQDLFGFRPNLRTLPFDSKFAHVSVHVGRKKSFPPFKK
jgi:hypothetical protein